MGIFSKISSIFTGKRELGAADSAALTDALIGADVAPDLAESLVAKLRARGTVTEPAAKQILFDALLPIVNKLSDPRPTTHDPRVILVIGVNGAGKTTTIGKMAKQFHDAGKSVVIAAADTFRAAANEQMGIWAKRANATLVTSNQNDPASVAYAAVKQAQESGADIVIIDTAGRLHNRTDLMQELSKITRVIKKLDADAPHETLLVLDANTGQNALAQIEYFNAVAPLSGLVVTKMDSTARGGFLATYAANNKKPLPVAAIGYGEKISDLRPFDATEYLRKLLG